LTVEIHRPSTPQAGTAASGLTNEEARQRLAQSGPNSMPNTAVHPVRNALAKFWSPIPWMLEAAIVLQLVLGDYVGAGIIAVLLLFNATLGYFQEGKAQATLAALRSRLAMTASVGRDGVWKNLTAAELVTGDIVKLSLGGVVAADVRLASGDVLLDQSMLTGESIPIVPSREIVQLGLTAVLASIPVALPATFTLAAALGTRDLAKLGVLPTRLSAVDEAASIDVLCVDKTGTLTRNQLKVTAVRPVAGSDESQVLALAAMASSDGGQDPVDAAIHAAAGASPASGAPILVKFVPFDPATKMSEATGTDGNGAPVRAVKGAFSVVRKLAEVGVDSPAVAAELKGQGFRVSAVAAGGPEALKLLGFIALSDPPRDDAKKLLSDLLTLGVRTVMVTGDSPETAAVVARAVGLTGPICPPGPVPDAVKPESFSVFAGVLPKDKFALVKAFQKTGHTVGMCGDGANDAPALRQAQMGIAVSTATDVAKSAAGIVLTEPGLVGIVSSVKEGRITFQRILTYTINSIRSKIAQVLFLIAGLLTIAGIIIGLCELAVCVGVLAAGKFWIGLAAEALPTLALTSLVFCNEAVIYSIRSRRRLWSRPFPAKWVIVASVADLLIASTVAVGGILMVPIPLLVVLATLGTAFLASFVFDLVKVPVFHRLQIA
jgi:H+-transporting ATPase